MGWGYFYAPAIQRMVEGEYSVTPVPLFISIDIGDGVSNLRLSFLGISNLHLSSSGRAIHVLLDTFSS